MIHILKRCYRIFLGYFLFVVILLTGIRLFLGQELNVFFTLISGVMIFLYTIFALLVSEQYEEKHHGYSIMSALPVSRLEVTAAKFRSPWLPPSS
jgi:flagellar motor component MotA